MNNQQQTVTDGDRVASKLLNRLALTELDFARSEIENDELKAQVRQLTEANQRLQNENQQLREQTNLKQKD